METTIQGHTVSYDQAAQAGLHSMAYMPQEEVRAFFEQAYNHGSVVFEDQSGTRYKLAHDGGKYNLTHA